MTDVMEEITALLPNCAAVAALVKSMSTNHTATFVVDGKGQSTETTSQTFMDLNSCHDPFTAIPAKPGVYACFAVDGRPIITATTGNLRRALQNRLAGPPAVSVRINYAEITDTIRYRRVGSAFAASWWYYQIVRVLFPDCYPTMLAWKPAWFLTVAPEMDFPRWKISNALAPASAITIGPLLTYRKASRLVAAIEELFDLCRYYAILRKAPQGQACAYKELRQCPAPCDGSISMADYRRLIFSAADFLADAIGARKQWMHHQECTMRAAAAAMDFRGAARRKSKLDQAERLCHDELMAVHNMDKWKYLILQRGKTRRWVAPFIAGPSGMAALPEVKDCTAVAALDAWRTVGDAETLASSHITKAPLEEIAALVAYHQHRSHDAGLYIPMDGDMEADTIRQSVQTWLAANADYDMLEINSSDLAGTGSTAEGQPLSSGDDAP
ncbi:MAG: hypothetical protein ACP5VQ_02020 [Phycisphaerae bacterium]